MSYLENQFRSLWNCYYPNKDLYAQYRFAPPRKYTLDFADPTKRIGIEIQGGIWQSKSGHSGGTGVTEDAEKICLASILGWRIFQLVGAAITKDNLDAIAETIDYSPALPLGLTDRDLRYTCGLPVGFSTCAAKSYCRGEIKKSKLCKGNARIMRHFEYLADVDRWQHKC